MEVGPSIKVNNKQTSRRIEYYFIFYFDTRRTKECIYTLLRTDDARPINTPNERQHRMLYYVMAHIIIKYQCCSDGLQSIELYTRIYKYMYSYVYVYVFFFFKGPPSSTAVAVNCFSPPLSSPPPLVICTSFPIIVIYLLHNYVLFYFSVTSCRPTILLLSSGFQHCTLPPHTV